MSVNPEELDPQSAYEAYLESLRETSVTPTEEKDTSYPSAFYSGIDTPLETIGGTLKQLGAEGVGQWLQDVTEYPENYDSATEKFINQQDKEFWFDFEWSAGARALVEQSGQLLGSLATRIAGAGIGAGAGAAAGFAAAGPPGAAAGAATGAVYGGLTGSGLFEGLQVLGPTVTARAEKNRAIRQIDENGNAIPEWEDWTWAAGVAGLSGALNAFGIKNLGKLNAGAYPKGKAIGQAASREFGTEGTQSLVQEYGSAVGTEEGVTETFYDISRQAFAEASAGGILGGGFQAVVETPGLLSDPYETVDVDASFLTDWREVAKGLVVDETEVRMNALEQEQQISDMSVPELTGVIERLGYKTPKIPGETREQVSQKLLSFVEEDVTREVAHIHAMENALSTFDQDRIIRETKREVDNYSPEVLATELQEEFGSVDNYIEAAEVKFNFDPRVTTQDPNFVNSRKLLTEERATQKINIKQSPTIYKFGKREFNKFVKDLSDTYNVDELRYQAQIHADIPEFRLKTMSKTQLATQLADAAASLQIQQERIKQSKLVNILDMSWNITESDEGGSTQESIKDQSSPKLFDLLKRDGAALTVEVAAVPSYSGGPREGANSAAARVARAPVIKFVRTGAENLPANPTVQELLDAGNGDLVLAPDDRQTIPGSLEFLQTIRENNPDLLRVGTPVEKVLGTYNYGHAYKVRTTFVPNSSLPYMQEDMATRMGGFMHRQLRPMMPLGAEGFFLNREQIGRTRSLATLAEQLSRKIDKAIGASFGKGEIESVLQGDELLMAFLRKTGAQLPINEEQRKKMTDTRQMLFERLYDPDVRGDTQQERVINMDIDALEAMMSGAQSTAIALAQVPESMRDVAVEARSTINALTTRLIEEIPAIRDDAERRATLQAGINQYVTRSFALYETALGWNPRFSKIWNKEMQKIYNDAVISMVEVNRGREGWSEETGEATRHARQVLDAELSQRNIQNNNQMINLPGVLEGSGSAQNQASFMTGGKLVSPRQDIPPTIRKLMGEINDPRLVAATSLARIAQLVEKADFYNKLKMSNDLPGEMLFSPKQIGDYTIQIREDDMNPLGGYWTNKYVADALGMPKAEAAGALGQMMLGLYDGIFLVPKGLTQMGMIVLSPATQFRNFAGAFIMFTAAGYIGKGGFPEAMGQITNELGITISYDDNGQMTIEGEQYKKDYREAQEYGLANTNVRVNESLNVFGRVTQGNYTTANAIIHALYMLKNTKVGETLTAPGTVKQSIAGATTGALVGAGLASVFGAATGAALIGGGIAVGGIGAGRILSGAQAGYAASDDFFKIAAWGADRIRIRQSLNSLDEKTTNPDGITDEMKLEVLMEYAKRLTTKAAPYESNMAKVLRNVTDLDKAIKEISAYHVRNTMPNYDYVGRFAQIIKKFPFGNFIAFPTEIARVTANIPMIAFKEANFQISDQLMLEAQIPKENVLVRLNDDEGTLITKESNTKPFFGSGMKRLVLGTGAIAGLGVVTREFLQMMFDVDDEELEAAAVMGPEYREKNKIAPLSKVAEDGSGFNYFDLTYYLPFAGITGVSESVVNAVREGEYKGRGVPPSIARGIAEWAMDYASQFTDFAIATEVSGQVLTNRKENGNPIWVENDDAIDIFNAVFDYVMKNAGPGGYRQVYDLVRAFETGDKRYTDTGIDISKGRALAKLMGLTTGEVNPNESFTYTVNDWKNLVTNQVEPHLEQVGYSGGPITEEEIFEQWIDTQESWFDVQQTMYFELLAFKELNLSNKVYRQKMIENFLQIPGVNNKLLKNLEKGIFTPWELTNAVQTSFRRSTEKLKEKQRKAGLPTSDIKRKFPRKKIIDDYRLLRKQDTSLRGVTAYPGIREKDQEGFRMFVPLEE
tara:strand:- start:6696 stop:12308 length:5613 start_codon:yes stop_codon:yes gene_type:complete